MLMFFLAFVSGSFCTCCFHVLMRMFDNKCVLFPRLVSHKSLRVIVYEFFSIKLEGTADDPNGPPDFVSAKWSDNSVCYLPTYVPLMSGLGGLVWATMFLMCSGPSTVTGPQRQWRTLPFIFLFSMIMSALCIYSSAITHTGLRELCMKLAEVTGTSASSYTINVATLAYERRIRGVYQATRLTIATAWLHTMCWLISALLVAARVLLAVDFTLVTVKAQLIGDMDKLLQKYEDQIHSISPDSPRFNEDDSEVELYATNTTKFPKSLIELQNTSSAVTTQKSEFALVPEEKHRLYIQQLLSDLVDNITKRASSIIHSTEATMDVSFDKNKANADEVMNTTDPTTEFIDVDKITQEIMQQFKGKLSQGLHEFENQLKSTIKSKTSQPNADHRHIRLRISDESVDQEPPKNYKIAEDYTIENNEQTNEKSIAPPTDSTSTLTPSYVQLNENKIDYENTQRQKKDDDQFDDIDVGRKSYNLDDVNIENEKRDTASVQTLNTYYDEILEENKELNSTEKELEKNDGTNESDRFKDVDTVHKLHISDESSTKTITSENENIDENKIENNEQIDKKNDKSIATLTASTSTLTPSYIQLNENKIAYENTQRQKKDADHFDDIDVGRKLYSLDDINIENEKRDTASVHTLTIYYDEILEENKELNSTEKELEKNDGTSENDRFKDVDTIHKLHISDESSTKTITPANENIDESLKKSKERIEKLEEQKMEKSISIEKDDGQDSNAQEELGKVEEKKKEEEDTKDEKDKGH